MNTGVGLILADSYDGGNFWGLAKNRSMASVPILGKYRLIDFEINHMCSNGISNIIIGASHNYQSLMHHIGTGKYYDLDRKNAGLHLLTPYAHEKWGDGNIFRASLRMLNNLDAPYIIITLSNVITDLDYTKMLDFHVTHNASITCLAVKGSGLQFNVNQKGRVTSISHKNVEDNSLGLAPVIIMDMNDYKRDVMGIDDDDIFSLLRQQIEQQDIFYYTTKHLKYDFIDTVKKYYDFSMRFLKSYNDMPNLQTRTRDVTPTEVLSTANIHNSLLADGSKIAGEINGSIIGNEVTVGKDTTVKDCIVFSECDIAEEVYLENCIIDKGVKISKGVKLIGEKDAPVVIEKSSVI